MSMADIALQRYRCNTDTMQKEKTCHYGYYENWYFMSFGLIGWKWIRFATNLNVTGTVGWVQLKTGSDYNLHKNLLKWKAHHTHTKVIAVLIIIAYTYLIFCEFLLKYGTIL